MKKILLFVSLAFSMCANFAVAQGTEPIRVIVPLSPGTPSDSVTRIVTTAMAQELKRPIIVDNKPGANGVIAVQELMKAKPDGNTLMLGGMSPLVLNPAILKNLPYDTRKDFTPIGGMYNAFQAYLVNSAIPINSFEELVKNAKESPGKLTAGHYSALTQLQLAALRKLADIDLLMVPYKVTTAAYTDAMSGNIDVVLADIGSAVKMVEGGKVRALAINLPEKHPFSGDLPPAADTVPGLSVPVWSGLVGPAGMSKEVVNGLNAALNRALRKEDVIQQIAKGGSDTWATTPEQFATHIDRELMRWKKLAVDAGLEPQ